jgi:small subunit ribosomal protein S21
VQVLVRDNNVDQALKVLKRKMQREGVFREMKTPWPLRKTLREESREQAEAILLARKKLQREGLPADEASGNPRRCWKSRPAARASLLILEQPKSTSSR